MLIQAITHKIIFLAIKGKSPSAATAVLGGLVRKDEEPRGDINLEVRIQKTQMHWIKADH